ncbi:MAG: hypothetical protein HXY53_01430 [Nitrospirae bacterium]|nr:hypothetical protein [Nitrospirota bacterium]
MAKASNVCIRIYSDKVPVISDALEFASMGMIPEGSHLNQKFCSQYLDIFLELDPVIADILADAQTSGGLLIYVPEEKSIQLLNGLIERNTPSASVIGEVFNEPKGIIQIR